MVFIIIIIREGKGKEVQEKDVWRIWGFLVTQGNRNTLLKIPGCLKDSAVVCLFQILNG